MARTAVSVIKPDGSTWSAPVSAVLPVNIALDEGSNPMMHIASAGARPGDLANAPGQFPVSTVPAPLVEPPPTTNIGPDAGFGSGIFGGSAGDAGSDGQVVSVPAGPKRL